LVILYCLCKQ